MTFVTSPVTVAVRGRGVGNQATATAGGLKMHESDFCLRFRPFLSHISPQNHLILSILVSKERSLRVLQNVLLSYLTILAQKLVTPSFMLQFYAFIRPRGGGGNSDRGKILQDSLHN